MSSGTVSIAKRCHQKSRSGCQQCKLRKVKCDERRPVCSNCARHFSNIQECDFGIPQKAYNDGPASATFLTSVRRENPSSRRATDARRRYPQLSFTAGAGMPDPFVAYPESIVPETQMFMHHYFSNFTSKSFPIVIGYQSRPFLDSWWSMASEDTVMFHATLLLSALDLEILKGEDDGTRPMLLLRKECIRLLRERVGDPVLSVSDHTIGSVLALSIVEFERGDLRGVRMHIEGLKRMVKIRGGLGAIRSTNPMLANLIFGTSMTVMTEPQFPPGVKKPQPCRDLPNSTSDTPLFEFESLGVSTAHAKIMREIKFMTNAVSLHWPANATPNYCSDVLVRLLYLPQPVDDGPLVASISECCRLATAILCFLPFRNDYPNPTLMINVQLHKLKAVLETMIELAPSDHPLLPWLLSVGGIYALPVERGWFIGHLVSVVTDMSINSWDDMKPHLVKVIWIEFFCEVPFRELWEDVTKKLDTLDLVNLDL